MPSLRRRESTARAEARRESTAREQRIAALAPRLTHPDPSQLFFQVAEIAGDLTYLRHGVELGADDVVLDVGANVGVAAVFFAVECGVRRVHCYEPVPATAQILRANVARLPMCVVHQVALGRSPGTVPIMFYPHADAMSGLYADPARDQALVRQVLINRGLTGVEADAQLVDRYQPETLTCEIQTVSAALATQHIDRVGLLKVDVERAELDVLAGVEDHDWPKIAQLVLEVHDEDGRAEEIATFLGLRGFEVAIDQEVMMRGTAIRMLYGIRRR